MNDLVSIVLPAYQAAATIDKTISSIHAQSHVHWELIVCVDAASDATAEMAKQWQSKDKRIKVLVSCKNRGVVRTRNIGIRLAKGDFLAFCDADDWWVSDKLERQLNQMRKSDATFCYTSAIYVSADGKWESSPAKMPSRIDLKRLYFGNPIGLSTAIYDTRKIGKYYFQKLPAPYIHEDYLYWLRLFEDKEVHACYEDRPTTYVTIHTNTRSGNKMLALKSQFFILNRICGMSAFRAYFCLITYLFLALHKRGIRTWMNQLFS